MGLGAATLSAPTMPSGPVSGNIGTSYGYYTKATDSDGLRLRYTYDWGDGTSSISPLVLSGSKVKMFHKWTVAGSYSLRIKATNSAGLVSAWSPSLQVVIGGGVTPPVVDPPVVTPPTNSPPKTPRIPSGSLVGRTTYSYTYKTMANDPDGDMVKYTVDWGDGTISTTGYVASGTYASASHKWSGVTPGTFKGFYIRAMATDIKGAKSAWSSPLPVSMGAPYVNHRPSSPVISGPTQCEGGVQYEFSIEASDPDANDTLKYLIHWGDYSTETAYFPSGQPATVYHTWNVPAGKTWTCKIIAVAVDPYQLGSLDWSEPHIVTVTGPALSRAVFADEVAPEVDENETVVAQTEEVIADPQTNESEPTSLNNTTTTL